MKTARTLFSASLALFLLPAATADPSDEEHLLWEIATQAQSLLDTGDSLDLLAEFSTDVGLACIWYEPGFRISTIVVDVNHYLIQIPVPGINPTDDSVGTNGEPAGTYFIQVSFSGASCST